MSKVGCLFLVLVCSVVPATGQTIGATCTREVLDNPSRTIQWTKQISTSSMTRMVCGSLYWDHTPGDGNKWVAVVRNVSGVPVQRQVFLGPTEAEAWLTNQLRMMN